MKAPQGMNMTHTQLQQRMEDGIAHEIRRLNLKGDDRIHAIAVTLSVLTHMRNAAQIASLTTVGIDICAARVMEAANIEEYEGPMGGVFYRTKE
jgi:hypothetical protein